MDGETRPLGDLSAFVGSERWFPTAVPYIRQSEGVQHVAQTASAFWLADMISASQREPTIQAADFQVWKLEINEDRTAFLICEDGDENEVHRQAISFTDFPAPGIKLFCCGGYIMLPSEY